MQAAARTDVVGLAATHDPITDEPKLSAINSEGQIVTAKTDTAYKTNIENTDEIRPGVSKFFDAQEVDTNFPLLVFCIFLQMMLRLHGLRADRRLSWWRRSRPRSDTRRSPCRTTSATASSEACSR